ncbi:MAG: RutC family protein [Proteobacteria bacterium]|nr:RutC family protein [Pseudomonadota bacterium]
MFTRTRSVVAIGVVMSLAVFGCATNGAQKQIVATKKAPEAIGPYSQAVKFGNLLFLAGQIAIDPKTYQLMKDASIEDQTRLALNNLKAVLEENGMTMDNALSTTVFLKDLNDFAKMNAVYAEFFKSAPPARATVEVARLPRDVKVEIAMIAGK